MEHQDFEGHPALVAVAEGINDEEEDDDEDPETFH
jgi:hypothetical protein